MAEFCASTGATWRGVLLGEALVVMFAVDWQMSLNTWRDYFLDDLMTALVDASLQLIGRRRRGEQVDLQLVASVVNCIGNISARSLCHSTSFIPVLTL